MNKNIIFDLDGLLVDTEYYYTKTWQEACLKYGIVIQDEDVCRFSGYNWQLIQQYFAKVYNEELAIAITEERESLLQNHIVNNHIKLKPYAIEVLTWLKTKNYQLAIASSSKKSRATQIVHNLNLHNFFEICVFGDDVDHKKPAPDVYQKAMSLLQVDKLSETIAVEDSLVGATSATRANLEVFLIPDQSVHQNKYSSSELENLNIVKQGNDLNDLKIYLQDH